MFSSNKQVLNNYIYEIFFSDEFQFEFVSRLHSKIEPLCKTKNTLMMLTRHTRHSLISLQVWS